jgi:transcriptional regulator with XRE-family HTH domain
MKVDTEPFSEALTDLLDEYEMSLRELTRRCRSNGWGNLTTIARLAHGEMRPSIRAMEHIAKALGIRPETFADYRLATARRRLDPRAVGWKNALKNLGK